MSQTTTDECILHCHARSSKLDDVCSEPNGHEPPHRSCNGNAWGFPSTNRSAPLMTTVCMAMHGTGACWRDQGHDGDHRSVGGATWGKHESDDPGANQPEPALCAVTNEITPFTCIREHGHGGLHQGANDQTWSIDFRDQPYPLPDPVPQCLSPRAYADAVYYCTLDRGHEGVHRGLHDHAWSDPIPLTPSGAVLSGAVDHAGCSRLLEQERRGMMSIGAEAERMAKLSIELEEKLKELCERVFDMERAYTDEGTGTEGFISAFNYVIGLAHDHAKPVELEDDLAAEIAKHVEDGLAPGDAPRCHECGEHVPCLVMRMAKERRELKETLDEHLKRGEG